MSMHLCRERLSQQRGHICALPTGKLVGLIPTSRWHFLGYRPEGMNAAEQTSLMSRLLVVTKNVRSPKMREV